MRWTNGNSWERARRRRRMHTAVLAVGLLAVAACSDDEGDSASTSAATVAPDETAAPDDTTSDTTSDTTADTTADTTGDTTGDTTVPSSGMSLTDALATLPGPAGDGALITLADLDRATELARLVRPTDPDDVDAILDWLLPMQGIREPVGAPMFVPVPDVAGQTNLQRNAEIHDELGWSVVDVDWYAEMMLPPGSFTVIGTDVDAATLDAAIGPAEDGVWKLGGEDLSINPRDITAARRLGESLRFGLKDGMLGTARATPPVQAWLAGEGPTLADDEGLVAMTRALDAAGAYAAFIDPTDDGIRMGTGLSVDEAAGDAIITFVYGFDDPAAAAEMVPKVEDLLRNGSSVQNRQPWSERFEVVSVTSEGSTLIAQVRDIAERPQVAVQVIFTRDNLATLDLDDTGRPGDDSDSTEPITSDTVSSEPTTSG